MDQAWRERHVRTHHGSLAHTLEMTVLMVKCITHESSAVLSLPYFFFAVRLVQGGHSVEVGGVSVHVSETRAAETRTATPVGARIADFNL